MSLDLDTYRSITARRAEILGLLAEHHTQREIADELVITEKTVESHVERLKQLTNTRSCRELGRWWQSHRALWLQSMARLSRLEPGSPWLGCIAGIWSVLWWEAA